MKNNKTIIARNKRNCCLKHSSNEHSGTGAVMSRWCSIGLMASGWKRWSCSDECKWVCMCKRVCFITFEPETMTVIVFSNKN